MIQFTLAEKQRKVKCCSCRDTMENKKSLRIIITPGDVTHHFCVSCAKEIFKSSLMAKLVSSRKTQKYGLEL